MKEELTVKRLTEGRENPFRVPDGYFDTLGDRLIRAAQAAERRRRHRQMWQMAAAVVVAFGLGMAYVTRQAAADATTAQAEYVNDALDYAMISNCDIELYLTEAQ